MNKDLNKPNKKIEFIGLILFIIGVVMILLRIFWIKELAVLVVGIFLLLFGAVLNMMGKFGLEKSVEITSSYEKAKAKNIAKGVKEGLKEEEK